MISSWLFIFEKWCQCTLKQKLISKRTKKKFVVVPRDGSADQVPDSYKNFTDPQHWYKPLNVIRLICRLDCGNRWTRHNAHVNIFRSSSVGSCAHSPDIFRRRSCSTSGISLLLTTLWSCCPFWPPLFSASERSVEDFESFLKLFIKKYLPFYRRKNYRSYQYTVHCAVYKQAWQGLFMQYQRRERSPSYSANTLSPTDMIYQSYKNLLNAYCIRTTFILIHAFSLTPSGYVSPREYWMIYRGPGFMNRNRHLTQPLPPLPSATCLSFSVFLCGAAGRAYWR